MNGIKNNRLNNYDLLRILCAIGVILIHVTGTYIGNSTTLINQNKEINYTLIEAFFDCIGRFAVPVFLMLTGVFTLSNPKNKNFSYFYKKSIKNIFVPTIIFTILYIIYQIIISFTFKDISLKSIRYNVIHGEPYYHLWYMYMLIGVYMLIPFIIRLKDDIGIKRFKMVSILFFPIAILSLWTTEFKFNWNFGMSFLYCSYVMIGYIISKNVKNKSLIKFIIFLILGILLEIFATYKVNDIILKGISFSELKYTIQGQESPIIAIASVFIFIAFSNLEIKQNFYFISNLTFYIYLIHAGVWDVIKRIFNVFNLEKYFYYSNPYCAIPVFTIIIFILSILVSILYIKFLKIFSKIKLKQNIKIR